jgi:hypothetical protein
MAGNRDGAEGMRCRPGIKDPMDAALVRVLPRHRRPFGSDDGSEWGISHFGMKKVWQ